MWCFEKNVAVRQSDDPTQTFVLNQGTVVTVGQQNVLVPGDPNRWAEIKYSHREYSKEKKQWLQSDRIGWVNQIYLDDYREDVLSRNEEGRYLRTGVRIKNQTEDPTDAQQYMVWDKSATDPADTGIRYNMCGELCVAYIIQKDVDHSLDFSLESVLEKWKTAPKEKRGSFSYNLSTIKKGTNAPHLQDMLQLYPQYAPTPDADSIMDLRSGLGLSKDSSFKWDGLQERISTHYLIALVIIDKSGALIPKAEATEKAGIPHWVLVENITCNGKWLVLYNPFPNRIQEYSFTEFVSSSSIVSGLWVKRKNPMACTSIEAASTTSYKVALDIVRPPDYRGAEQYIDREGGKKTNLCGEFSVAYILTRSMDHGIKQWKEKQPAETRGFITILQAYSGLGKDASQRKPFTIGTVLDHWREVQPLLYKKHVIDNETTSSEPLKSILRAYGYTNPGDFTDFTAGLTDPVTRKYLPSPGRMAKMLETHFLIAGVGINKAGIVKNRGEIRHWVVVEKMRPVGRHYLTKHFGGNGGWVELYNPFMNVMEEYSYLEFANSMSETGLWSSGLWVKRNVDPVFTSQVVLTPVQAIGKPGVKVGGRRKDVAPSKKEKVKPPRGEAKVTAQKKSKAKPARRTEPRKLNNKKALQANTPVADAVPVDPLAALASSLCKTLEVKSIPPEIIKWISSHSRGNSALAVALAATLRNFGVLAFQDGEGIFKQDPRLPAIQTENPVVHEIGPAFAMQAVDEIRKFQNAA